MNLELTGERSVGFYLPDLIRKTKPQGWELEVWARAGAGGEGYKEGLSVHNHSSTAFFLVLGKVKVNCVKHSPRTVSLA